MYICMDLDDTLLNSKGQISEYNLKVLQKCQKLGHKLIINSARNLEKIIEIFDKLNADFGIACAGAVIIDKNKDVIYKEIISENDVKSIIKHFITKCNKFSISSKTGLYTSNPLYSGEMYFDFINDVFLDEVYKIVINIDDKIEAREFIENLNLSFIEYRSSKWCRISPYNCSKWKGLEKTIEYDLGKLNESISFGDDLGDLDMLENSYIGIAMANSTKEVLSKINNITSSNDEDGVGKFLVKYFNLIIV